MDALMIPAVAGDLMAPGLDVANELRVRDGDLSDDKESGSGIVLGKKVEQPSGRRFHPRPEYQRAGHHLMALLRN